MATKLPLLVLSWLVFSAQLLGDDPKEDENKKELKRLEGTWKLQWFIDKDGKKARPEENKMMVIFTFKGDALRVEMENDGRKIEDHPRIRVDASKTPRTLDFIATVGDAKGKTTMYAIYVLEGDTLKIFSSLEKRPTKFSSDPKKGDLGFFKRVKQKEK